MLDDELRSLVSVEPGPDFEAGVRLRIREAATAPRSPWAGGWVLAPAFAIVLAFAAAVAVILRDAPQQPAAAALSPLVGQPQITLAPLQSAVNASWLPSASVENRMYQLALPHVQVDPVEARALQELFRASAHLPPSTGADPLPPTIVIPELSIAPLEVGAAAKGDFR